MNPRPRFESLHQWLGWQETLHPSSIDLGLERVGRVADRLRCRVPAQLVISVAGTNGKGSALAMLEAVLLAAGYRVGCYSSPHLLRYNERLRLQGEQVSDAIFVEAFERVDRARGDESLTYFEFGTLAALDIMCRNELDVALLEVGLGGRLDAVNIVDADAALLTSIGIDHTDWLGADRESIGREKAGIFRASKPAVCGDANPPGSVAAEARRIGAEWRCRGTDFGFEDAGDHWHWHAGKRRYRDLPRPALPGTHQLANAAAVLMVLAMVQERLPVTRQAIETGLQAVQLPGRIQIIPGEVEQVLDVAHNAQAAQVLADTLDRMPVAAKTHAVIGMMRDKDAASFVRALAPAVSDWYPVGLRTDRASTADQLRARIESVAAIERIRVCHSPADALLLLRREALSGDRIVVCGSFYTVSEWVSLNPVFE
jgi:dihydrofolate synthase/folylpolyglutamate synthase